MFQCRCPGQGCGADDLGQERLGGHVAMQDVVLAALLVVQHDLHGDLRAARPARVGRGRAVAGHVAGVAGHIHLNFPSEFRHLAQNKFPGRNLQILSEGFGRQGGQMAGFLTTHVLDTARGCPAAGLKIALYRVSGNGTDKIAEVVTNADGRTDADPARGGVRDRHL
jgi:hypothetical protein